VDHNAQYWCIAILASETVDNVSDVVSDVSIVWRYINTIITSAKEVMFSSVSVCLSEDYSKTADQIFMKFYKVVGQNPGS